MASVLAFPPPHAYPGAAGSAQAMDGGGSHPRGLEEIGGDLGGGTRHQDGDLRGHGAARTGGAQHLVEHGRDRSAVERRLLR